MPSGRQCFSCVADLPIDAAFCPGCGTATPTQLSEGEFTAGASRISQEVDQLYRERLSSALGPDFVLEGQIGQGGFGVVYAARDSKLRRTLAVKVLRHDVPSAGLDRFLSEAQVVAGLRHPNIVPIHFIGEGDGLAYMTMPLLEGQTLCEALRHGRMDPQETVRVLIEMCDALSLAHAAGVVHRDIKPENIYLEGPSRRVVLMDFGIAKLNRSIQNLTASGVMIGTPAYMSPEQMSADPEIDGRSDVYSVGAVAYEMLTGRLPFQANTLPALISELLTSEPPEDPLIEADVPVGLRQVVLGCLAKKPDERVEAAGLANRLRDSLPSERSVSADKVGDEAGRGVGTLLVLSVASLFIVALGISWFDDVAEQLALDGLGQGFRFAVDLFVPVGVVAKYLAVAGVVALFSALGSLYSKHRQLRKALAISFSGLATGASIFFCAAGILAVVLLIFVIPTLQTMAASVNTALPFSLRLVIAMSDMLQTYWWVALPAVPIIAVYVRSRRRRITLRRALKEMVGQGIRRP